jgi:hypothetical protein
VRVARKPDLLSDVVEQVVIVPALRPQRGAEKSLDFRGRTPTRGRQVHRDRGQRRVVPEALVVERVVQVEGDQLEARRQTHWGDRKNSR